MVSGTLDLPKIESPCQRSLRRELLRFVDLTAVGKLRSRIEFAKQEIIIPEGPFEGKRWRPGFQPYTAKALALMDESDLRNYRFTGSVQSGKSFLGLINVLWHLFERCEDVGYAVPDLDQSARDKWKLEFVPTIEASPNLREMRPQVGEGSQGGTPSLIRFANGATLRFIPGSGKDHHRSNYTLNVVFQTEVDRYDEAIGQSRETSPPEQIINRTKAYGNQAWTYEECTVTTEEGRIWSQLQASTNHKFWVRCPHCNATTVPGRENLKGVEDAASLGEATEAGGFYCLDCGEQWSESDRLRMLDEMILVADGQTVEHDGKNFIVSGEAKDTNRLGFSWNDFHNKLETTKRIVVDEYNAIHSPTPDASELKRRQHAWTTPAEPRIYSLSQLTAKDIRERGKGISFFESLRLGVVPEGTIKLFAGIDVGKHFLHFIVRAFFRIGDSINSAIVDIGEQPVRSKEIGVSDAIPESLRTLKERFDLGYRDASGSLFPVAIKGVDGGWQGDEVGKRKEYLVWSWMLTMVSEGDQSWLMTLGRGQSEPQGKGTYSQPKKIGKEILQIGDACHIRRSDRFSKDFQRIGQPYAAFAMVNADEYKNVLRDGYEMNLGQDGAVFAFNAHTKNEQQLMRTYSHQVTAEERKAKQVKGRGTVVVYNNKSSRKNHFGDADYNTFALACLSGIPIVTKKLDLGEIAIDNRESLMEAITMPDGRAIMDV